jgi:transcription antitermination factor NusG
MHRGQFRSDLWLEGPPPALKAWYALQTRYQCEKRVDLALRDEGFDTFAPVRAEQRRWSDRTKLIHSPLFPGYTFVRMEADSKSLLKVMRLPGIVRFVTTGRELIPIPDDEIEAVRGVLQSDASYEAAPFPAVGERVRIRGGCLDGIEGILTSRTKDREIVISVGAIQRALKVPLGGYRVERLFHAS